MQQAHIPNMMMPEWPAEYVGIPFEDYGRSREGADCWGLARMIWLEQVGIDLPDHGDVDPNRGDDCAGRMRAHIGPWVQVLPGMETEFDGVLMMGCTGIGRAMRRLPMHVGVVVMPGTLIHTDARMGAACIEKYRDRRFGHDIVGFWRHRSRIDRV